MPARKDSRQRLIRAAIELFGRRGYHDTSIAAILKESGCTRGVLYYYFSSKEELGYAAIEEEMRLLFERGAVSYLKPAQHPIDCLLKAVDALPTAMSPGVVGSSTADISVRLASVHEGFRKRLARSIGPLHDRIEEMVRRGVADGQIVDSVNPQVLAHVIISVGAGIHLGSLLWEREVIWEDARRWLKEYLSSLRK